MEEAAYCALSDRLLLLLAIQRRPADWKSASVSAEKML